MILLDTNILIEIFKGNVTIANKLSSLNDGFVIYYTNGALLWSF
jgi:predicted nucleic acid-binding protein